MKKLLHFLVPFLLLMPFLVSADSYGGPSCLEPGSMNSDDKDDQGFENGYGYSPIRGTCKVVSIGNIVLLETSLQKDYFLGTHEPLTFDCGPREGCSYTKFSEKLLLTNKLSLKSQEQLSNTSTNPSDVAVFDKSYFLPLFNSMSKKSDLIFSEDAFNPISIYLLKKDEYQEIKTYPEISGIDTDKMDSLTTWNSIVTHKYQEYGNYIHAPKGILAESQYVKVVTSKNKLTNKDLGIEMASSGRSSEVLTVKKTSPLEEILNYYVYTKQNGKLVLMWQKTEYTLDDGSVRTITKDDKNMIATIIFGKKADKEAVTASTSSTTKAVQKSETIQKHIKVVPTPLPASKEKGVFQKIINFFTSLFS